MLASYKIINEYLDILKLRTNYLPFLIFLINDVSFESKTLKIYKTHKTPRLCKIIVSKF